jgi:probable phosphoglycerate mutase
MLCRQDNGNTYYYTSPYGRARDTASLTLQKLGRQAEVLTWLKEFDYFIWRPDDTEKKRIPWDWLPQDWTQEPRFYQEEHWAENELMAEGNIGEAYRRVTEQFDELLARHGYRREGRCYRVEKPNHDTIVLFCHFGVESVLLSHLWGVSPMPVWHGFCAQTSSVTTLVTEERRKGIASIRMLAFGDTSHLYVHDEPPAFAARFCECCGDDTRHD